MPSLSPQDGGSYICPARLFKAQGDTTVFDLDIFTEKLILKCVRNDDPTIADQCDDVAELITEEHARRALERYTPETLLIMPRPKFLELIYGIDLDIIGYWDTNAIDKEQL